MRAATKRPGRIARVLQQGPLADGATASNSSTRWWCTRSPVRTSAYAIRVITEELGLSAGLLGKWQRHKENHFCMDKQ